MLSVSITTDCKRIIKRKKAHKNGGKPIVPGEQACAEPGGAGTCMSMTCQGVWNC